MTEPETTTVPDVAQLLLDLSTSLLRRAQYLERSLNGDSFQRAALVEAISTLTHCAIGAVNCAVAISRALAA